MLLNTCYKLISGVLTEKIKPALNYIIQSNQKAYLKNRYIGEVTRTTYDLFSHAKNNNIPGLILLIDFEKAFDSVSNGFILSVLKVHGFGPNFIKWISIILSDFKVSTNLHGNIGQHFTLGRGCRQGDPISGYLFILCIEILLLRLLNNSEIKAYRMRGGQCHLAEAYADDLTLFLRYSRCNTENSNNIEQVIICLSEFQDISGLNINIGKTKLSSFGRDLNLKTLAINFKLLWCTSFKLLCIIYDCSLNNMECNYSKAIDEVKKNA